METDSQIMNYVVRMVVPMRREFGRQLDVGQFLHDVIYAREVLDEALRSRDTRLQEYARVVETRLLGPRAASATPVPAKAVAAEPPAEIAKRAPAAAGPSAEELRARIMKKYTDGLR
jgi:hypothetical protein